MNKQRVISIVAILCLAQLAIIISKQAEDKNSELGRLGEQISQSASRVGDLLTPSRARQQGNVIPPADTILKASSANGSKDRALPPNKASRQAPTRDPFVPFFSVKGGPKETDQANPLTSYDLSELRVVAIVRSSQGKTSASVETKDGKSFIVKNGTKIGAYGGTVSNISATTIYIEEPSSSLLGDSTKATREISLKTAQLQSGIANEK
jgi:Tfp pilus assembly protein PilP